MAATDGPALVRTAILDQSRVLLGLHPIAMRNLRLNPDAQHGVFMITPGGIVTLMQGVGALPTSHLSAVLSPLSGLRSSRTSTVHVREWSDRQLVVSAAPMGETGIVVASVVVAEVTPGTPLRRGLMLGFLVLLTGWLSFLLIRASLVAPLAALLTQAKADACGAVTESRRSLRIAEAYRIAQALAVSSYAGLRSRRWRPTAMQGLVLAAVVALVCPAVAVAVTVGSPQYAVPVQLIRDEESRAEAVGANLGNALEIGLGAVSQVAFANANTSAGAMKAVLRQALREEHRLRAVYLVDAAGRVLSSAGRRPLRTVEPLPGEGGLRVDPSISRLPVIYAYRTRPDGSGVVGEFDIDYLLGLMRQADGRVRVVDSRLFTVLDSEGYRAFQPLQGAPLRRLAVEVLPGGTLADSHDGDGSPALIAGTGLLSPAQVAHFEWAVLVERDLAALQLPAMVGRRWTLLISVALVGVVLLTLAWQFFVFVRPLRRLAEAADRIARGEFDEPVVPQRHDDVGAIAMCLEICRQVRHTGSARFGGAFRLRGSEANHTAVLPRPQHLRAEQDARV